MLASYHGHAPLVSLLLKHKADPNRVNDRGQSILAGVVFKNEAAVIKLLLDGGADPEVGEPSALEATKVSDIAIRALSWDLLTTSRFSDKKNMRACFVNRSKSSRQGRQEPRTGIECYIQILFGCQSGVTRHYNPLCYTPKAHQS